MISEIFTSHLGHTQTLHEKIWKIYMQFKWKPKAIGRDKINFIPEIITRDKDHYVMIRAIRLSRSYNNH